MSYLPTPPKASMLFAPEIPPTGGDTSFCDMHAAFETLADDLRNRAAGLRVKHDGTYNSGGYVRQQRRDLLDAPSRRIMHRTHVKDVAPPAAWSRPQTVVQPRSGSFCGCSAVICRSRRHWWQPDQSRLGL